jgi:hypothetical protein
MITLYLKFTCRSDQEEYRQYLKPDGARACHTGAPSPEDSVKNASWAEAV